MSDTPTPEHGDPVDVDEQLARLEHFIEQVQTGRIGTSAAMAAYRDVHRPAIARLRAELDAFRALLDEADENLATEAPALGPDDGGADE